MPAKKTTKPSKTIDSFEADLQKLEDIVAKMEDKNCSLDEAFLMFEDGVGISKRCSKILESYERKIYLIKENKSKTAKNDKSDLNTDDEHYLDIFTDEA